jgi:hypothetical protein
MVWWMVGGGLLLAGFALTVAGAARRYSDGGRRCPHCGFELHAGATSPCSECGGTWRHADELPSRPARRRVQRLGVILILLGVFGAPIAAMNSGRHWTNFVPRPILRVALDASVTVPPPVPPAILPVPEEPLRTSRDRWDRLQWQAQAATCFDRFLDEVEAFDGSPGELERLARAAIEAGAIKTVMAGTLWADGWPSDRFERRLARMRPELDARFDLPLGTWVASELQYFDGVADQRWNWIEPPVAVLEAFARSADPRIRAHAVNRASLVNTPAARALLEGLAEDPDPAVRELAGRILEWRRTMRRWD